jgi:tetratricopeptide (TPR) repeat protein
MERQDESREKFLVDIADAYYLQDEPRDIFLRRFTYKKEGKHQGDKEFAEERCIEITTLSTHMRVIYEAFAKSPDKPFGCDINPRKRGRGKLNKLYAWLWLDQFPLWRDNSPSWKQQFSIRQLPKIEEAVLPESETSLTQIESIPLNIPRNVVDNSNYAAAIYNTQGHYSKNEQVLVQTLEVKQRLFGNDHPATVTSRNNLLDFYKSLVRDADSYASQVQYSKAEPLYVQALTGRKHWLGNDHPDVANSLNQLASLYYAQGHYRKAEPLFIQALELYQRLYGNNNLKVATLLNNLAELYKSQGRYSEAEALDKEALALRISLLGEDHIDVAASFANLAALYYFQGRYQEAESLHIQALEIKKRLLGNDHPNVAASLNNLAELYKSQGRYAEAEPLHEEALATRKRCLGNNYPDVAASLNNLASLYND